MKKRRPFLKKRRPFYYISWALIWTLVPLCSESADDINNNNEIFVFPSMQMEGISEKSDHVPMVEVIYRGQPPPPEADLHTSTTSSSREVISSTTESTTTKGKYKKK